MRLFYSARFFFVAPADHSPVFRFPNHRAKTAAALRVMCGGGEIDAQLRRTP